MRPPCTTDDLEDHDNEHGQANLMMAELEMIDTSTVESGDGDGESDNSEDEAERIHGAVDLVPGAVSWDEAAADGANNGDGGKQAPGEAHQDAMGPPVLLEGIGGANHLDATDTRRGTGLEG